MHAVEEVFAYAEKEKWSVEKTQKEMIESEIYIISRTTGIDEELIRTIRREFKEANGDIEKIQNIAQVLIQKYDGNAECPVCVDFIRYIRDSLLIFSRTISGDPTVDETFEAKDQIRGWFNLLFDTSAITKIGKPFNACYMGITYNQKQ